MALRVLVALALTASLLPAERTRTWDRVQALERGRVIRIIPWEGKPFKAIYTSSTADELRIQVDGSQQTIARDDIKVIRRGGKRGRHMAVGAGIGAGIAAITFAAQVGFDRSDPTGAIAAFLIAIGAGIGVGVVAAMPTQRAIYKAPKR